MSIKKIGSDEDYILYKVLCDYCDREYSITYDLADDEEDSPIIECCPFCSNLIEEPDERFHDDEEDSWD